MAATVPAPASVNASAVSSTPRTGGLRRRAPAPRTVLWIASLGTFMAFVDATIVNIAFPDIERSFRGSSLTLIS